MRYLAILAAEHFERKEPLTIRHIRDRLGRAQVNHREAKLLLSRLVRDDPEHWRAPRPFETVPAINGRGPVVHYFAVPLSADDREAPR